MSDPGSTKAVVTARSIRVVVILCGLVISALACNLVGVQTTPVPTPDPRTLITGDGTRPSVAIEAPPPGSQALVNQQITVRLRATDSMGITQVVLQRGSQVAARQRAPEPTTVYEALLPFTPSQTGQITLTVIAYRGDVASEPASVTVEVVSSVRELRNPGSLDPTAGVASGLVICTAQVNNNTLNLRGGPGTSYPILARLGIGEALTVVGRNADSSWYQVRRVSNQQVGWVSAQYVITNGDCSQAPVVAVP